MISASDFKNVFPVWQEPLRTQKPGGLCRASLKPTGQEAGAEQAINNDCPEAGSRGGPREQPNLQPADKVANQAGASAFGMGKRVWRTVSPASS